VAGLGLRYSVFGPRRRTGSGTGYPVPGAGWPVPDTWNPGPGNGRPGPRRMPRLTLRKTRPWG